jgi:effector-binding domain-containing protein
MRTYTIQSCTVSRRPTAVSTATLPVAKIGPWLAETYGMIAATLTAGGPKPAGAPFARYHKVDSKPDGEERFVVEAGFPVATPIEGNGEVRPSSLPGGPVAMTVHIGPYNQLEPAYDALAAWIRDHAGEPVGDAWEIYFSDPVQQPDPATWRTEVVQPYRSA